MKHFPNILVSLVYTALLLLLIQLTPLAGLVVLPLSIWLSALVALFTSSSAIVCICVILVCCTLAAYFVCAMIKRERSKRANWLTRIRGLAGLQFTVHTAFFFTYWWTELCKENGDGQSVLLLFEPESLYYSAGIIALLALLIDYSGRKKSES